MHVSISLNTEKSFYHHRRSLLCCFLREAISINSALFMRASSAFIIPPSSNFLTRCASQPRGTGFVICDLINSACTIASYFSFKSRSRSLWFSACSCSRTFTMYQRLASDSQILRCFFSETCVSKQCSISMFFLRRCSLVSKSYCLACSSFSKHSWMYSCSARLISSLSFLNSTSPILDMIFWILASRSLISFSL